MILDRLSRADAYAGCHPQFAAAFEFLRRSALAPPVDGRIELGGGMYALVQSPEGRGRAGARVEAHDRYIDIQYVLEAQDTMGWRERADCREPAAPFDAEHDIVFFRDAPLAWFDVPAGHFAVFYPHDAHAPLGAEGRMRKIVVKVPVLQP